jgi:hypothetical protein
VRDAKSWFAHSSRVADARRPLDVGAGTASSSRIPSTGSAASRRRGLALCAMLATASAMLAVLASPASALDTGHSFSFSFKPTGTSELGWYTPGIAVDSSAGPSAGDIYVGDYIHHRVVKFDPNGSFILMFGAGVDQTTGGSICTAASGDTCKNGTESGAEAIGSPYRIAVDQNTGAVFVSITESKIAKYDENGNLVTGWGESGYLTGGETSFSGLFGISVTSTGDLLVATNYSNRTVEKFATSTGAFIEEFHPGFSFGSFAYSPQGFDYFVSESNGSLKRINANNTNPVWFSPFFCCSQPLWEYVFTVDSTTGDVYSIIQNYNNGETKVAEWQVDGSGQPLAANGSPCPTTLTESEPGCAPTHEFGYGLGYYGDPQDGGTGEQRGIAVNATNGMVYTSASTDGEARSLVNVFVAAPGPLVTTEEPVANKKVSGTVKPDGAGEVVECWFEFGTTKKYGSKQNCAPAAPYSTDQAVTAELPLTNETSYHYRLVAKNAAGAVNFGADMTITPHNVEGLKTDPAENVTRKTALLKGHFEGNGQPTTYWFEWGINTSYLSGSSPHEPIGSPTAPPSTFVNYEPTNLEPETTYHYRLVAENTTGITFGNDVTFKTLPAVQSLATEAANPVGRKFATLHGSFQGDGSHTSYYFEWGKTTSYGEKTPVGDAGSPAGHEDVAAQLTGLALEQTYHFRVVATNPLGTTRGGDQEFTTLPAVPGLLTKPATEISQTGITLNAEYSGNGEDTHYWWEYGQTTKYGQLAPAEPADAGSPGTPTQLSTVITDYEAYSTYHFRIVAENPEGKTIGQDLTFETLPALLPDIIETEATEVTATSAMLIAQINPNRWPTVYRFEYGPGTEYGESTEISGVIGNDQFPHEVSQAVTNLEPGTLYHLRVVAINFTGTEYGPDMTFVTPGAPRIDAASASSTGQTTAHLLAALSPNSAQTTAHFEYGTTGAYGKATPDVPVGSDAGSHQLAADIGGLEPGTTYHVRLVAANQYGTTTSTDHTFTNAPQVLQAEEQPQPVRCKKGFVKRHGKCVKKHKRHKKHHHHRHSRRSHG